MDLLQNNVTFIQKTAYHSCILILSSAHTAITLLEYKYAQCAYNSCNLSQVNDVLSLFTDATIAQRDTVVVF